MLSQRSSKSLWSLRRVPRLRIGSKPSIRRRLTDNATEKPRCSPSSFIHIAPPFVLTVTTLRYFRQPNQVWPVHLAIHLPDRDKVSSFQTNSTIIIEYLLETQMNWEWIDEKFLTFSLSNVNIIIITLSLSIRNSDLTAINRENVSVKIPRIKLRPSRRRGSNYSEMQFSPSFLSPGQDVDPWP